ncbi:MAG: FAD-binding oxidoreductase [Alphaproteobacteria bacterium]
MYSPLNVASALPEYYALHAPPPPETEALGGDRAADVAIIGAGYTGLSAALDLAEKGVRAVVVDANDIGWGASGRAFGQVVPYAKQDHDDILAHFGRSVGQRLIDTIATGPDLVFGLIEKHGMSCSAVRQGVLFASHSPEGLRTLERRAAYWQSRGSSVEMLDRDRTSAFVGSELYRGSCLDHRGGTINPLAYARGLAHAAVRGGAVIHTHSRVTSLDREGGGWVLATPRGRLRANVVILGTNAYTDHLWPGLRESIIPLRGHQLVSEPLSDNLRRSILPGRQSMTDTRRLFSGVRMHADGRLHVSSDGPAFDPVGGPYVHRIKQRLATLFPYLGDVRWDYTWSGWVAMTVDHYPHLHALAPGLFAGIGYSGRGIAMGTLMGKDLAALAMGGRRDDLLFPVTPLKPTMVSRLARPLVGSLMTYYRFRDGWSLRRHIGKR